MKFFLLVLSNLCKLINMDKLIICNILFRYMHTLYIYFLMACSTSLAAVVSMLYNECLTFTPPSTIPNNHPTSLCKSNLLPFWMEVRSYVCLFDIMGIFYIQMIFTLMNDLSYNKHVLARIITDIIIRPLLI